MLLRITRALRAETVLKALESMPDLRVCVPLAMGLGSWLEQLWYAAQFRHGLRERLCVEARSLADLEPYLALIVLGGLTVVADHALDLPLPFRPTSDVDGEVGSEEELEMELLLRGEGCP